METSASTEQDPRERWAEQIRSPAEQADLQVRSFPHDALRPLAETIRLRTFDRLLNLGGSVGVLASHLSALLEDGEVVLADGEAEYLRAEVPSSLYYETDFPKYCVDYKQLPFDDDRFDGVIVSDVLSFHSNDARKRLLEELRRVLDDRGRLIFMEPLEAETWVPWGLQGSEDEEQRMEQFNDLRRRAHDALETRLFECFDNLPHWLNQRGVEVNKSGGWFLPTRLNDSRWTERQRTDLINLRHQARRDQVEIVRRLLNASNLWESDHASLLRDVAADWQQQALRKRNALESDRETGWSGRPMLLVQAAFE